MVGYAYFKTNANRFPTTLILPLRILRFSTLQTLTEMSNLGIVTLHTERSASAFKEVFDIKRGNRGVRSPKN